MIERPKRTTTLGTTFAIHFTQVLFGFGIHGELRIAFNLINIDQLGDPIELSIVIGMLASCQVPADLTTSNPIMAQPILIEISQQLAMLTHF